MRPAVTTLAAVAVVATAATTTASADCTVSLTQQISSTACVLGKNFGCNGANKTMWIRGGCRGKFTCDGQPMECWSVDMHSTAECACKAGPFHPPQPPGPPAPPPAPKIPFVPMDAPNMNGGYFRSETGTERGARQPVKQFKDYPGGARFFDVYSPVFSTLYSQVYWDALAPVNIPQDVIDRYANGGVMAMIGIECDQVRKNATGDGKDVSVPISAAYNHHFTATLAGAKTSLERVEFDGPMDPRRAEFEGDHSHGMPGTVYRAHQLEAGVGGVSTHLGLGGGNGGEYRKTYHGFPAPYARLLESPHQFQFTPMQIDTWNRDEMNISEPSPKFVSGPQPHNSLAKHKDALYSGLLECPLTTRINKTIDETTAGKPFGQGRGYLTYMKTNQTGDVGESYTYTGNYCAEQPRSDLLAQRNPTCDHRTYTGGQIACHHMWSLLDAEQVIPWPDQPLEYQIKFRFWYQDYNASFHKDLQYSGGTTNWDVGAGSGPSRPAGAEYDVPQCNSTAQPGCKYEDFYGNALPEGSPNGTWVHYLTGEFYIGEKASFHVGKPIVAHMHCHAPTCISMAVYNNETGAPICMERATYGGDGSNAAEKDNAATKDRPSMNEPGFVAVPPCVWGESSEYNGQLVSPPELSGVKMHIVKRCNATFGHHGEMAHGQIFYAAE